MSENADADWVLGSIRSGVTRPSLLIHNAAEQRRDPLGVRGAILDLVERRLLRWTPTSRLEECSPEPEEATHV